jgi:hypothetical protein
VGDSDAGVVACDVARRLRVVSHALAGASALEWELRRVRTALLSRTAVHEAAATAVTAAAASGVGCKRSVEAMAAVSAVSTAVVEHERRVR